jgi:hypothetical protein
MSRAPGGNERRDDHAAQDNPSAREGRGVGGADAEQHAPERHRLLFHRPRSPESAAPPRSLGDLVYLIA